MTATTLPIQHEPLEHHGPPAPPRGPRRLLYPGFLRAAWMAALFFGIGCAIVVLCRWWGGWHPIWKGEIIVLVAGLVAAPIGFLSDHMEVLYDLDVEAAELCKSLGVNFVRAESPGLHPAIVRMFALRPCAQPVHIAEQRDQKDRR